MTSLYFIVINLIVISAVSISFINLPVNGEETERKTKVLEGSVLIEAMPAELYGTWNVKSTLISTNNPFLFRRQMSDIWTLRKDYDNITLSNPVSGATSTITVNDVQGNKAVFTRKKEEDKRVKESEVVEISIGADTFSGTDTFKLEFYDKNEVLLRQEKAIYRIEGDRISGPALKNLFTTEQQ